MKRAIGEGLVDAEAVAAVRRVPSVGALARPEEAKRVDPSRGLEASYPAVLLRVEGRHFLVEIDQPGVGVAHEEGRSPTPRVGHAEDGVEEGKLAAGKAGWHVRGAQGERGRPRHGAREPRPPPGHWPRAR